MYPRCCRINFGFYSSTLVDKEPKYTLKEKVDESIISLNGFKIQKFDWNK